MDRSEPTARRAGTAAAALACVALASSAAGADLHVVPIDRFVLTGAGGVRTPYLTALGGRRPVPSDAPTQPTAPMHAYQLHGDTAGLRRHDADGSGRLDPSELTHAWMLAAVELVTGRRHPPSALAFHPSTAQLSRGTSGLSRRAPMPALVPATGTVLPADDQRLVRNVIEDPRATGTRTVHAALDAAEATQQWYGPPGGDDGGSTGGGAGGGTGGGSSGGGSGGGSSSGGAQL